MNAISEIWHIFLIIHSLYVRSIPISLQETQFKTQSLFEMAKARLEDLDDLLILTKFIKE